MHVALPIKADLTGTPAKPELAEIATFTVAEAGCRQATY